MKALIYRLAVCGAFWISASAMLTSGIAAAQEQGQLEACARLEDPQARLNCYDEASRRPQTPTPSSPPATANDDEQSRLDDDKEGEPLRLTLTDCREGPTGKWYFYFEDGQVWQQKDNDRFSMKHCNGVVTIRKDFFGYKLEFSGTENKIRAGRVQ